MPAAAVAAAVAASTAAPASPCGFPPASLTAPPSLANPLSLGIAPSVVLTKPLLSAATAACAAQPSASPPLLEALLAPLPKMLREEPSYAPAHAHARAHTRFVIVLWVCCMPCCPKCCGRSPCTHMHEHARTHTHTHELNVKNLILCLLSRQKKCRLTSFVLVRAHTYECVQDCETEALDLQCSAANDAAEKLGFESIAPAPRMLQRCTYTHLQMIACVHARQTALMCA
eukprot:scaffold189712_cov21-Tisochrysis_lutea.AAC.2